MDENYLLRCTDCGARLSLEEAYNHAPINAFHHTTFTVEQIRD